jgi:hypothetical protein
MWPQNAYPAYAKEKAPGHAGIGRRTVPSVQARTLARAAHIVGGVAALANRLRVSAEGLQLWLSGKADPPSKVFLEAIDIVFQDKITHLNHPDDAYLTQQRDKNRG